MATNDYQFLVGKVVKHNAFGEGTVLSVSNTCALISFPVGEKKLAYTAFKGGKIVSAVEQKAQDTIESLLKADEEWEQQNKAMFVVHKPTTSSYQEPEEKSQEEENSIWLKFEGSQNKNNFANVRMMKNNDQVLYFLNFSEKNQPFRVKDNDEFFTVETFTENLTPVRVITGRGHLYGFSSHNRAVPESEKTYQDLASKPYYVVMKDFEMLNVPIKYCLRLQQVINTCKKEAFTSAVLNLNPAKGLLPVDSQKDQVKITELASEYINTEFDKLVNEYGSSSCVSTL